VTEVPSSAPVGWRDPRRLEIIAELGLSGHDTGLHLEAIVRTVSAGCRVPVAVLTIVTPGRETYAAEIGRGAAGADVSDEHSFCSAVASTGLRLVVGDARRQAAYRDHPLVRDGSVRAFGGEPLHHRGAVIGSLAMFDPEPRAFRAAELVVLHEQARLAEVLLEHHRRSRRDPAEETVRQLVAARHSAVSAAGRRLGETEVIPDRPLQVLLAEDNRVNQMVAKLILAKLGHRVDIVDNGLEAVEAVQRGSYDVVLMDLQMPVLDGLGATLRIRAELPVARQPAIVAVTANTQPKDRAACARAGMDSFVAKPFAPADLKRALSQVHTFTTRGSL
jgi:CheY-like chemotaxis protein